MNRDSTKRYFNAAYENSASVSLGVPSRYDATGLRSRRQRGMSAAFSYEQDAETTAVSVRVAVPPATTRADVAVTLLADRLSVSVKGHSRQPHVLDDTLYYDVDPDSMSWALEGSGNSRALLIELEKAEPVDWDEGLFRVESADTEPLPTIQRDLSRPPAKTVSAGTPVSGAHAAPSGAAPPPSAAAEALRFNKAFDERYEKALDKLRLLVEEKSKREGAQKQTAEEIWADLMSGKKRLMTKDGVFEGAEAVKAALGIDLTSYLQ